MQVSASAQRYFASAESLRAQGLFSKALSAYERALKVTDDSSLRFEACLGIASICRSLGDIKKARFWIKGARVVARRSSSAGRNEAIELEDILIERADGKYVESLKRLRVFFGRRFQERDFQACGFVKWAMGGALRFSGNLQASENAYRESLAFAQKACDRDGKIYALLGLGGVYRIQGKIFESARYYRAAGNALSGSGDLFAKAYAYCGLGNALRQKGEWDKAENLYRKSRALYQKLGDAADLGYVEWGLARLKMQTGKIEDAEGFLKRAIALFNQAGEKRGLVLAKFSLAQAWHARGKTAEARLLFDQAVRLSKSSGLSTHLELFT
jgi:tetratricopeptide (TPR) repeat protein